MKIRRNLAGLLLAGLTACSSTRVHLFTQGVEPDELIRVQSALEDEGFATELNSLRIPDVLSGPTLLYSPSHDALQEVEALGNLLMSLGYDVSLEAVARGNHFYTGENIGLYLAPLQTNQPGRATLSGMEFNGDCPSEDAYLTFESAHRFSAEFISWDDSAAKETVKRLSGTWYRSGDSVHLQWEGNAVELSFIPLHAEREYGDVTGYRLLNPSDRLSDCDFVFREVKPN
ncbi:hypothetical protein F6455_07415 [Proteobacteria bacterium 005FR1]|nr:hypothetical protein [Proteobacteria bacterium 005FR1]